MLTVLCKIDGYAAGNETEAMNVLILRSGR
jgi:hypothetical protein